MIAYLKGEIINIEEELAVIEVGNIGYNVRIPARAAQNLPAIGSQVKIYTYLHVREDAMNLFGFLTKDDLSVFKLLLSVNGIGPKGALGILSVLTADDLRFAVLSDDVKAISKAPGVGSKTAQRLIIELKDKLKLEDAFEQKLQNNQSSEALSFTDAKGEAVQALIALGYSNTDALKAVRQVEITDQMDAEIILKHSLKKLAFL